jgi:hypothetical protein
MKLPLLAIALATAWNGGPEGKEDPKGPPTARPAAQGIHAPYDRLLHDLVRDGEVDYARLKAREKELDGYLETLGKTDPSSLSRPDELALWLNAYNAFTLKLILERYPGVKSIKDIPGHWKKERWVVGGKSYSLGGIEDDVLRKGLKEARIHFGLVCASRSCPDLPSEAFTGERIDEQLAGSARRFLLNPHKGFTYRREPGIIYGLNNNVYLSSIFKWFRGDFESAAGSVIAFITPYLPPEGQKFVEVHQGDLKVHYLDYDWSLNGR